MSLNIQLYHLIGLGSDIQDVYLQFDYDNKSTKTALKKNCKHKMKILQQLDLDIPTNTGVCITVIEKVDDYEENVIASSGLLTMSQLTQYTGKWCKLQKLSGDGEMKLKMRCSRTNIH